MRPHLLSRKREGSRTPQGFTLVETLIALILIEVGLLALTASSAVVIRETMLVRARVAALETARNRIESIAATRCTAIAASSSSPNGSRENWSARLVPSLTREIRDSVTFTVQRVSRTLALSTRTPCAP
jgi:Tfp pilus assembly protein PilV